jgi:hypothetical protein
VSLAGFAGAAAYGDASQRTLAAYACLTVAGASLVWLAPCAQALVLGWPGASGQRALTTVWTGATPLGFLAAPQLATWLLPALGLAGYFAGFAALPIVFGALVLLAAVEASGTPGDALPLSLVLAFVAVVVAFEAWSTAGSLLGYGAAMALASLPFLVASLVAFARHMARFVATAHAAPAAWTSVAALFLLQLPTTGFFEAAFLFDRVASQPLVADRATLAAAAQMAGTFGAGLALHRAGGGQRRIAWVAAGLFVAGIAGYVAYPRIDAIPYFMATAALAGLGVGALTLVLCLAIVRDAGRTPLVAALPSIAIMIGTEAGLELLQCVFAAAQALGADAYSAVFVAQALAALGVLAVLRRITR